MDRSTAYQLVSMLEGVPIRGTARRLASLGLPLAGKTGTTNESRDAWFIGFTPNLVAGCFIGYDNPKSMGKEGTGGGMCGPVFKEFMEIAMATRTVGEFVVPEDIEFAPIDRFSGIRLPEGAEENDDVILEPFRPGQAPELYETAKVIGGDESGGFVSGGDLPSGNDLPLGKEPKTLNGAETIDSNASPKTPKPSGNLDDDLDSGGLY
jgi:penicillin-binding protein 1A